MADPIRTVANIGGLHKLSAARDELRSQRAEKAQKPELPDKSPLEPIERKAESPLEGISGSTKANAYMYWPKDGSDKPSMNRTPGPMERMRLWNEAVSNVVSGDTEAEPQTIHPNILRAADSAKGALSGAGVKQRELAAEGAQKSGEEEDKSAGCETCAGRKYKDGSNDSGVSFQSAKSMPASTAAVRVASHEGEHATRETAEANKEGSLITNKRVTFQYGCCPECNRMYIKGGTTSITKQSRGEGSAVAKKMADMLGGVGEKLNMGM